MSRCGPLWGCELTTSERFGPYRSGASGRCRRPRAWVADFGVLGFINQLEFFSTEGDRVLGLSSNGLLSTVSVVVGGVLIGAGARGGRTASTVTAVIGVLFLLSGLGNLAVLNTSANLLASASPT